jgi:hypothetical protein
MQTKAMSVSYCCDDQRRTRPGIAASDPVIVAERPQLAGLATWIGTDMCWPGQGR